MTSWPDITLTKTGTGTWDVTPIKCSRCGVDVPADARELVKRCLDRNCPVKPKESKES